MLGLSKILLLNILFLTITTTTIATNETVSSQAPPQKSRFYYTNKIAEKYVWPTVPIAFLIIGTIGNILSIIVFTRREMLKYSAFCYFAILNCINLALLYVTSIRSIMDFNFKIDIRSLNLFTCKLHVFLTYFLGYLSSLMLSMISIDRVISVVFLVRTKQLCTPRIACYVTLCIIIFNFLVSSHFLYCESGYTTLQQGFNQTSTAVVRCQSRPGTSYQHFILYVWKIVDMSLLAFIPFAIMSTCSIIIIIRVAQQSKKLQKNKKKQYEIDQQHQQQKMAANTTANNEHLLVPVGLNKKSRLSVTSLNDGVSTDFTTTATTHTRTKSSKKRVASTNDRRFSSRTRNLALMMLPVNILFLIFLAPVVITIYFYESLGEDDLTLAIVELLSQCNHTFNFFIYFVTSSKFREEFYKFFNINTAVDQSQNKTAVISSWSFFKCFNRNRQKNEVNSNKNTGYAKMTVTCLTNVNES